MHCGVPSSCGGDGAALISSCLRSFLRALHRGSKRYADRDLAGFAPRQGCETDGGAVTVREGDFPCLSPLRPVACCLLLITVLALASCKQKQSSEPLSAPVAAPAAPAATPAPSASDVQPSELDSTAKASRPSGPIEFTDVTAQAGIHFKHNSGAFGKKYLPETMGSGACFLDYDNDGWQDILLVNSMDWPGHKSGKSFPALYHNNKDGTFTDVTRQAGLAVEMYGLGCAVGDYDNDGYDDVYITTVGSNHLFRNLHNGKFADMTTKAGVADPGFSASAVWFDYDNDGKLDLFVTHYIEWSIDTDQYCSLDNKNKSYCTPQRFKGQSSTLFHNKGDGTFENVTKKAGLYDPTGKALGVAMLDYDNDGWMDLFVTNDTEPNKLYHNNHDGTFTDVGVAAGLAYGEAGTARAGMGTDAADYDNSGWQSLVLGNFTNESMSLYHNDGSGLFTDEAAKTGIATMSNKSLTFGTFFFDYDLDGLLDILAVNGHVSDDISIVQPNVKYAQPPHLFHNLGDNKFEEMTVKVGSALPQPIVGRGAAYADIDNDGDLDLVITANNGPARLLRNDNGNEDRK